MNASSTTRTGRDRSGEPHPATARIVELWRTVGRAVGRWGEEYVRQRKLQVRSVQTLSPAELMHWDRDSAFILALAAFRQGELHLAESELTRGDGDGAVRDARCLNLLGVIHECRGEWTQARRCYSRAARGAGAIKAARTNLRRYYELVTLGKTEYLIDLGE